MSHHDTSAVWTDEYKGFDITIYYDDSHESPRDGDNLATIIGWHRRYDFGDTRRKQGRSLDWKTYHALFFSDDGDLDDFRAWLKENPSFILPIYMYEHGGVALSTGTITYPFTCPWDSGQVGYVYITKAKVRDEWKVKRISPKLRAVILRNLEYEVNEYSHYLNGDVFGYSITKSHTDDTDTDTEDTENGDLDLGTCYGYYGSDDVTAAAKEEIDSYLKAHQA